MEIKILMLNALTEQSGSGVGRNTMIGWEARRFGGWAAEKRKKRNEKCQNPNVECQMPKKAFSRSFGLRPLSLKASNRLRHDCYKKIILLINMPDMYFFNPS